jgi:hypothetical protein
MVDVHEEVFSDEDDFPFQEMPSKSKFDGLGGLAGLGKPVKPSGGLGNLGGLAGLSKPTKPSMPSGGLGGLAGLGKTVKPSVPAPKPSTNSSGLAGLTGLSKMDINDKPDISRIPNVPTYESSIPSLTNTIDKLVDVFQSMVVDNRHFMQSVINYNHKILDRVVNILSEREPLHDIATPRISSLPAPDMLDKVYNILEKKMEDEGLIVFDISQTGISSTIIGDRSAKVYGSIKDFITNN